MINYNTKKYKIMNKPFSCVINSKINAKNYLYIQCVIQMINM